MATPRVLYIHSMMFHGAWQCAAKEIEKQGVKIYFAAQDKALETLAGGSFDILIAELSVSGADFEKLQEEIRHCPHRLGLSVELSPGFTTYGEKDQREFEDYCARLSVQNYAAAILFLASRAGFSVEVPEIEEVHSCGIYHPAAENPFYQSSDYLRWQKGRGQLIRPVGILFYYGQLVEGALAEIDRLIELFEAEGLTPVAIFSAGIEEHLTPPDWYQILQEIDGLGAIVNFMAGRFLRRQEDSQLLVRLGLPVFQALRSHSQTPEQWLEDPEGLPPMSAVFSQTYPEMAGATRPTLIAGVVPAKEGEGAGWLRRYQPVDEQILVLAKRLRRHFRLKETGASEKRLTIVLHNNPCKGVEATLGMAVGLDSFASLAELLRRLQREGYDLGDCPMDGDELLAAFLDKKAMAEFRWTTVDEIVAKGGSLYMMGAGEYLEWFDGQPKAVREKVIKDWGAFPGEGMVWQDQGEEKLVITGLAYGNIHIINQPKRGCYGAKCTGEVCRILHDPALAPPHHWLATYKYIRDNSDAVLHFGTEGALEYLPGKQNGLSQNCFPEVSLGDLPNFYVYVMDAIGEGMVAKRRGQATLIDHLGPVFSAVELDSEMLRLESLLNEYHGAKGSGDVRRREELLGELKPLLLRLQLTEDAGDGEDLLESQLDLARRRLAAMSRSLAPEGLHILGKEPSPSARGRLLATMLRKPPAGVADSREIAARLGKGAGSPAEVAEFLAEIGPQSQPAMGLSEAFYAHCQEIGSRLEQTGREIDQILSALEGGYIEPGPAGSLAGGRLDLLPTGRNFYAKDVALLPTEAAYRVGCALADTLLVKYLEEEGRFPEQIGMSLWSSDAYKCDGEQFCQILHLMGIRPLWDKQGKVEGLAVIPLEELQLTVDNEQRRRPRIDVTIETSGIMRDMVPNFCQLLDQAVVEASGQDESHQWNYVKKNTDQVLEELQKDTSSELDEKEMRRMASFRLFTSAPGTYGVGVGLALDASAWTTDKELAEIYINWGGHALAGGKTRVAREIYAKRLAGLDIAYMKQAGEEYDILDCGCYAVSQGSMATATRALSGRRVKLYWNEAGSEGELCDVREQLQRSAAGRLLNGRWIEAMKGHGYQGAMAVSNRVNNLYKWSATSRSVDKELFERVVETYLDDEENRSWLMKENPYAMEEITRRLLEAASRNLWQADEEILEKVKHYALEIEGEMEDIMGEVKEEFQGGKVEVLGAEAVDKWQHEWRIDRG